MGALITMARAILATLPRVGQVATPIGLGVAGGTLAGGIPDFGLGGLFGGGGSRRHRHRRRKMFTDTDLAQFAAAEAIGGRKTAAALMMIRAAKA